MRFTCRVCVVVIAALCAAPTFAAAQGGSGGASIQLSQRVDANYFYEYTLSEENSRLVAVVLSRSEPGWRNRRRTADEQRTLDSLFWAVQTRVRMDGRSFFGSAEVYGEMDRSGRLIWIEGQQFTLPERDSTLVVMVDGVGGEPAPRTVQHTYISAAIPPSEFWGKSWSSGDTTFSVRPRHSRQVDMLTATLRRSPVVREFLELR